MLCKAAAMGDEASFRAIRETTVPVEAKVLGRKIRNFDQSLWDKIVCSVAYSVLLQKFSQNDILSSMPMNISESLIAEASITDNYWGIGLKIEDRRTNDPTEWQGCNILGWALMEVRKTLRKAEDTQYCAFPAEVRSAGHEK